MYSCAGDKSKRREPSTDQVRADETKHKQNENMKLQDAIELQALLATDSNYSSPTIWNHGDGYLVETVRADGAKVTAKVSGGNLIVEVSNQ